VFRQIELTLEVELEASLNDGYREEEWLWLEKSVSPDERACIPYKMLRDTGFVDQVVRMGSLDANVDMNSTNDKNDRDSQKDEGKRQVLSQAYGAIVRALVGSCPLWKGMEGNLLRAILAKMRFLEANIADEAIEELGILRSDSACRKELVSKWQKIG
jgi:hypothetical protein